MKKTCSHFVTLPWKILFSVVPDGILAYIFGLILCGMMTYGLLMGMVTIECLLDFRLPV